MNTDMTAERMQSKLSSSCQLTKKNITRIHFFRDMKFEKNITDHLSIINCSPLHTHLEKHALAHTDSSYYKIHKTYFILTPLLIFLIKTTCLVASSVRY